MTDEDLGDPFTPQPGDPQTMSILVDARDFQAIIAGLGELPAKLTRQTINKLEGQMRQAVLTHRRALLDRKKAEGAERQAAAEERRQRRQARHARVNGTAEPPAAQPTK